MSLDVCSTCTGTGIIGHFEHVNPETGEHLGNEPVECEVCVGGLVVSENGIEAVAEALYVADVGFDAVWDNVGGKLRSAYRDLARAAVTTLVQQWRTK